MKNNILFDYVDMMVDDIGLKVAAKLVPFRHSKSLCKKLMTINGSLHTERPIVGRFPLQCTKNFWTG